MDELISDILLWTPTYGRAKSGRLARTYIQQLCEDTGCSPEDLPEAMNDREKWRERVRDIRATSATWWWWWWCLVLTAQFRYGWSHENQWFCVLWFEECVIDSCFGQLYCVKAFLRAVLYLSSLRKVVEFSVTWFPAKQARFRLRSGYFSCHVNTNRHKNKKFTFYFYHFSVDN